MHKTKEKQWGICAILLAVVVSGGPVRKENFIFYVAYLYVRILLMFINFLFMKLRRISESTFVYSSVYKCLSF